MSAPHASPHGRGHDAAHGEHPTRGTFVTIFLTLGFLTVIEVFVPEVYDAEWNRTTKMLLLVLLAVGKALLVAMYFMHLKWEKTWVKWIALMPAYMGLAAIILMCEQVFRGHVR